MYVSFHFSFSHRLLLKNMSATQTSFSTMADNFRNCFPSEIGGFNTTWSFYSPAEVSEITPARISPRTTFLRTPSSSFHSFPTFHCRKSLFGQGPKDVQSTINLQPVPIYRRAIPVDHRLAFNTFSAHTPGRFHPSSHPNTPANVPIMPGLERFNTSFFFQ